MNVFVCYSDENFNNARSFSIKMARLFGGFDKIISMTPNDIDSSFKEKNYLAFNHKRGGGLWIWKPYIVNRVLTEINHGDIVFYADAGCFFFRNCNHIAKVMTDTDLWCTDIALREEEFTKNECFSALECDTDEYRKTNQRIATFFAIRKTPQTLDFVKDWLDYSQNYDLLSPANNVDYHSHYMISHREDQSLFSLLSKKYKFKPKQSPTIDGRHPEFSYIKGAVFQPVSHDYEYPCCIILHKKKKVTFKLLIKSFIKYITPYSLMSIYAKHKMKQQVTEGDGSIS